MTIRTMARARLSLLMVCIGLATLSLSACGAEGSEVGRGESLRPQPAVGSPPDAAVTPAGRGTPVSTADVRDVTDDHLPEACSSWFGSGVLAIVCDPDGDGGGLFSVITGDRRTTGEARVGVAQLGGSEPLGPGSTVRISLRSGSIETVAALRVQSPAGPTPVVITPFDPPARSLRVTVTARDVRVLTDDDRQRTIRLPRSAGRPTAPAAGSPREALEAFASRVAPATDASLAEACTLLADEVRPAFESDQLACAQVVAMVLFYDDTGENPDLLDLRVLSTRTHDVGGVTVANVRLRAEVDGTDRKKGGVRTVNATVPLVRQAAGWRLLDIETFRPQTLMSDPKRTDAQITEAVSKVRKAAAARRDALAEQDRARTSIGRDTSACPGRVRSFTDPARDVRLADGGDLVGDQTAPHDDVVRAELGIEGDRLCVRLQLRTRLPQEFAVQIGAQGAGHGRFPEAHDEVEVRVSSQGALGMHDGSGDDPSPLSADADVSPDRRRLVISLPAAAAWPTVRLTRRLRWTVTLFETAPALRDSYMEQVPENQQLDGTGGIPWP